MHDAIALEKRGIPVALICSRPFAATARMMAKIQGVPDQPFVMVPHPIGSLGIEELRERAREALPQVLEILLPR